MAEPDFQGLSVLALESRRADEIARLIEHYGGRAVVAPALRELPLGNAEEIAGFLRALAAGNYDLLVLMTGVGLRILVEAAQASLSAAEIQAALRRARLLARGPKPVSELRRLGLDADLLAPEPNTWREILAALEAAYPQGLAGLSLAVLEYGLPGQLQRELESRGARVRTLRVYRYALPEDTAPLRAAIAAALAGRLDVMLLTSSQQAEHLLHVAAEMGVAEALRRALQRMALASIGPDTSLSLRALGLHPDLEPAHPHMGFLVREAAGRAPALLRQKRASPSPA